MRRFWDWVMGRTLARLSSDSTPGSARGRPAAPGADRDGERADGGKAVLRPAETLDLAHLVRTFTLPTRDGFVENFGPGLIARVGREAPGVRLRFLQKTDRDSGPLRGGTVDLETGVVRKGHPLCRGKITPARYAAGRHISVSRQGLDKGRIDEALEPFGLERQIAATVGGSAAMSGTSARPAGERAAPTFLLPPPPPP